EIDEGRDFFEYTKKVDWIITNPPWSLMRDFLRHAMTISDNVIFLVTTNHAFTKARVREASEKRFGISQILHVPTPPPARGRSRGFSCPQYTGNATMMGRL